MDIMCPKCSAPVEVDYLHDVVADFKSLGRDETFHSLYAKFIVLGCEALDKDHDGRWLGDPRVSALYDMLGDDVDGAASMIEDFGLL